MLKDILVHVDTGKHAPARLAVGLELAARFDAHLIGLHVKHHPHVPQFILSQLGPEVVEAQRRHANEAAEEARQLFEGKAKAAGVKFEWRAVGGHLVDVMCLHAKYADLIIAGQVDPELEAVEGENELIDHLVLDAGRPVLVTPYIDNVKTLGTNIMVAWNGSREATRAVADSMPFLTRAKKVHVLSVNPDDAEHGDIPGADISLHLARHGVNADAQHVTVDNVDPGNLLLSRAADENADLIVMGAYGRSRLRELVLGGVTRHILRHMTVPVLMSH